MTPDVIVSSRGRERDDPDYNDDAVRVDTLGTEDGGGWTLFVAVADGAGSMPFSAEWAQKLVKEATPGWIGGELGVAVARVRSVFDPPPEGMADLILRNHWRRTGTAATLLVAELRYRPPGRCDVRASIVGDCLLVASTPKSLTSVPMERAADFDIRTTAVQTAVDDVTIIEWSETVEAPACIALMTDGMGAWLLTLYEADGPEAVYRWLCNFTPDELPDIEDDATLVVIHLPIVTSPQFVRDVPVRWWHRLVAVVWRRSDP